MKRWSAALAGLAALVLALNAAAQAAQSDPAALAREDARLDALWLQGEQRPDAGLRELDALPPLPAAEARRRFLRARLLLGEGAPEQALRLYDERLGTPADALAIHARLKRRQGELDQAALLLERALQQLQPACAPGPRLPATADCDPRLWHDLLQQRVRVHLALDETGPAQSLLERALDSARAQSGPGGRDRVAELLGDQAELLQRLEQPQGAWQRLAQAQREANGEPLRLAQLELVASYIARRADDRDGQLAALRRAESLAQSAQAPLLRVLVAGNLADYFLHRGEPSATREARRLLETALNDPERPADGHIEQGLRHNLAVALVQLRELAAARQQLQLQAASRTELPPRLHAAQLRELGQAWAAAGQWAEALKLYHEERKLTLAADQREREAALGELRSSLDARRRDAELALLREQQGLQERQLANQQVQRWLVALGGLLVLICLVIGGLLWRGSRVANRELRRSREQLKSLNERDPLTGLGNRRAFQQRMAQRGAAPLQGALLLIDLDHFKRINDNRGHAAGDQVLQAVAARLRAQVRQDDLLVRWGGEEFLLYAPDLGEQGLRQLVLRLLRTVEQEPVAVDQGAPLAVSCSIGFARFPLPPQRPDFGWEQAVNWVDQALYAAKNSGRARGVGIASAQLPDARAIAQIEADFDGAVLADRVALQTIRAERA